MTIEQFEAMVEVQAGLCAICTEPMKPGQGTAVDHCHATGLVRGVLCINCNVALGHMKDNAMLLEAARTYLEKSK